ncbi:MAG: CHAT domain-containing protein [Gammaproteobacteria bacterium]|nr:CHAT domain-containing protein [Gammaproteobacteria bacterium]
MTDIGEAVSVAVPPQESDDTHDELELEITDILDADGTSIMDGANDFDPRQSAMIGDTRTKIQYEVRNQSVLVFVTIEATTQPARDYYRNSDVRFFIDLVDPGSHEIEWDGRGVLDRRLVIEGDYSVKITGLCPVCATEVEQSKTFHVRKPFAHCFGGIYDGVPTPSGGAHRGDYTGRANSAKTGLESLSDNSGFESLEFNTETGASALVKMHEDSAVFFWGGHGGPGLISFPTPGLMTALVSSDAVKANFSGFVAAQNCATVSGLPDNALEDVFLIVLCGCETAQAPANALALPQALVAKGADIVVGFDDSVYTVSANNWTRRFFIYLKRGMGVRDAVRRANRRESNATYKARLDTYRIVTGPGTTENAKLTPARHGRKNS